MQLSTRHLLGIKDLRLSDIELILSTAAQFKEVLQRPIKKVLTLAQVSRPVTACYSILNNDNRVVLAYLAMPISRDKCVLILAQVSRPVTACYSILNNDNRVVLAYLAMPISRDKCVSLNRSSNGLVGPPAKRE